MSRSDSRLRLVFDLSDETAALLDHVSSVLGVTKAHIASRALVDALPLLIERADAFKARAAELRGLLASDPSVRSSRPVPGSVIDAVVAQMADHDD